MRFGPWEIGLILVIVLIVFGVGKLPQISKTVGNSIREFRKAQSGEYEGRGETEAKGKSSVLNSRV